MTFIQGHAAWNKGKKTSKEIRVKISQALMGRKAWNKGIATSEATRRKISKAKKGQVSWNKGKKWSPDVIAKMKENIRAKKEPKKGIHSIFSILF